MNNLNGRELKCCGTMEQAELYVWSLVINDCKNKGIYDMNVINDIMYNKSHDYGITQDMEFDEVGNLVRSGCYYVYLKTKNMTQN